MSEQNLQTLYATMNLTLPSRSVDLAVYQDASSLMEHPTNERMGAALRVFIESMLQSTQSFDKIDKSVIDAHVAFIDQKISAQLDEIFHNEALKNLESAWLSLLFVVNHTDFRKNVKIEFLNAAKLDLEEDFEDSPEIIQSGLYKHVYMDEYDTPGGEPYATLISNFEFSSSPSDIAFLTELSHVAASAHCPFIGAVGPRFFGKETVHDLPRIEDLENYMDRAEYIKWRSFRNSEDARYVGLTLPRFLLRLPYGENTNPVREFNYREEVTGKEHSKYLWGNASFAFAANMVRSFIDNGWCVQIRGPEAGGKVEHLPIHTFDVGKGSEIKIPTEILIPETREFEFANQGFIPLSFYKNRDYACFFSAASTQKPAEYDDPQATANCRINARLPYLYLTSRLAHYLKVLQRENIGATKSADVLSQELNAWLKTLVTQMKNPDAELAATHPLAYGEVKIEENPENPGFFKVSLCVIPHFQVEGFNVNLSLVSKLPQAKK